MEKFSAYRDPGTGIQPFLVPVPPQNSETYRNALKPLLVLIGAMRFLLVSCLGILHIIAYTACFLLAPVPPLYQASVDILTAISTRLVLLVLGVYWIHVEIIKRKRGRPLVKNKWSPAPGDLVVSNWISCLELLWLAFRLNPIFVLPIVKQTSVSKANSTIQSLGNENLKIDERTNNAEVVGFTEASLLRMMCVCGYTPNYSLLEKTEAYPLGGLLAEAKAKGRVVVVLPEFTTSNGRGLLHLVDTFKESEPPRGCKLHIMCVRVDPPTSISPTLSHPIPTVRSILNLPLYILSICCSILPHKLSIKLLAPPESPSLDQGCADYSKNDSLMDLCATAMSEIGRLKRTRMTWADKAEFLELYRHKSHG